MKASDIITQLHRMMPIFTNKFNTELPISSLTMTGLTVTATTASPHGLSTGNVINIQGAIAPNPISSLTQTGNIASAVTSTPHSLKKGWDDTVNVSGAVESDYNGVKTLLSTDSQTEFTYQIENDPTSPATGSPVLNEVFPFGYNGLVQITVTSPTTFTYASIKNLNSPATGTIVANTNIRISGSVDLQKALDSYTAQNDKALWAFVVMEDVVQSKNRAVTSDADNQFSAPDDPRSRLLQNFSIYVFATATAELSARLLRDDMEDVNVFLVNSIMGFEAPSGFTEQGLSKIIFVSHNLELYNSGIYIHRFQYQTFFDITFDDTVQPQLVGPFRKLDLIFRDPIVTDGDDVIMETKNIELYKYE